MKWLKSLLWMAIFFFAIHFSIQNRQEVVLQYSLYHFSYETARVPLFLVIFCSVFVGILIGGIADLQGRVSLKRTIRRHEEMIEKLEREAASLHISSPSFPHEMTRLR